MTRRATSSRASEGPPDHGSGPVAALCRLSLAFVLISLAAPAQTPGLVARASDVSGRVLVTTGAGLPAFALTRGYALNPGDRVDTRGGGRVVIDLSDGSMVVVHPETVLTLKDFRAATSLRELFEITMGLVRVKINHFAGKPNPYRMNSPTASVAVRGTEFTVAVQAGGETQIEVYEGAVEVSSLLQPESHVLLEAGRGVLVRPGQEFQLYNGPTGRGVAFRPDNDRGRAPAGAQPVVVFNGSQGGSGGSMTAPGAVQPPAQSSGGTAVTPSSPQPPQIVGTVAFDPGRGIEPPRTPETGVRDPRDSTVRIWTGAFGPAPDPRLPAPTDFKQGFSPSIKEYTDGGGFAIASRRAVASAYDQFTANLADVNQYPFLYRYTAFAEPHLDSLENPAYATGFHEGQGRFLVIPSFGGFGAAARSDATLGLGAAGPAEYGVSPQVSMFTPVLGQRLVVGASMSAAQVGSDTSPLSATSKFVRQSVVAATKMGRHSFGLSFDRLQGDGTVTASFTFPGLPTFHQYTDSRASQRRVTAGWAIDLPRRHKLGAFVRYGGVEANEAERPQFGELEKLAAEGTKTSGHSVEAGVRLRGSLAPRLSYGVTAQWMGLSLSDSVGHVFDAFWQRERLRRGSLGAGVGWLATRRTLVSVDFAAGMMLGDLMFAGGRDFGVTATGSLDSRFVAAHAAVQRDLTRRLFASASYLHAWRSNCSTPAIAGAWYSILASPYLSGSRFSDFGAGWRFTPSLTAQYIYSTAYGATSPAHAVMLRYTFKLRKE
jgi:hypothetical protein